MWSVLQKELNFDRLGAQWSGSIQSDRAPLAMAGHAPRVVRLAGSATALGHPIQAHGHLQRFIVETTRAVVYLEPVPVARTHIGKQPLPSPEHRGIAATLQHEFVSACHAGVDRRNLGA